MKQQQQHGKNVRKNKKSGRRYGPKPMKVFDVLAQDNLGGDAGRAFSRLKRRGEFDQVRPSAMISTLTATGEDHEED
jgi:hypothetical protein